MKINEFIFNKDNADYKVVVTYKWQKNIYYRFRDNIFLVSAPYFTTNQKINEGLNNFFYKLINSVNKKSNDYNFKEDYVYLLGEQYSLLNLKINTEDELYPFLYQNAKEIINNEVRKYEQIMGINKPYKIKIKKTVSQFGSNSKNTRTLSFRLSLIHYSLAIIDTVIVHELAHEFERNHQKGFYDIVYKYCPEYKNLQKKLKKGIHK